MLGDVEIDRLLQPQRIAGRTRSSRYILALRGQIGLGNADRHQLVVFHFELGAEIKRIALPDGVAGGFGGAIGIAREGGVQGAGQRTLAAVDR